MYNYIYDFIINNLFNSTLLDSYSSVILGVSTNMNVWISHTLTIISMVLIFIIAVLLIKSMFKLVVNLFRIK